MANYLLIIYYKRTISDELKFFYQKERRFIIIYSMIEYSHLAQLIYIAHCSKWID